MDDLSGVVQRLRTVRQAQRRFMQLWAVEQAVIAPGLDRVAADIESAAVGGDFWEPPRDDPNQGSWTQGE